MDWDIQCDELAECDDWAEWQVMRQAEVEADLEDCLNSCWEKFWQEVRDAADPA